MKKGTLQVAVAVAALMGMGAATVKAETPVAGPSNNTVEIRVINHNAALVRVFVQDAKGGTHELGRVAGSDFGILEIPGALVAEGAVTIRVYPSEPVWSLLGDQDGIRTKAMSLKLGDAVNIFLEPRLDRSQVEVQRG